MDRTCKMCQSGRVENTNPGTSPTAVFITRTLTQRLTLAKLFSYLACNTGLVSCRKISCQTTRVTKRTSSGPICNVMRSLTPVESVTTQQQFNGPKLSKRLKLQNCSNFLPAVTAAAADLDMPHATVVAARRSRLQERTNERKKWKFKTYLTGMESTRSGY